MTREEEILKAGEKAFPYADGDAMRVGFECGAMWADETMLNKACEWLEYVFKELEISGIDDWVESFKNAMKGE